MASFIGLIWFRHALQLWMVCLFSERSWRRHAPPAWLNSYDGSLALVANGQAYAALRRDPATCARTVSLISLSGTTGYEMSLPRSDICGVTDRIQADGTVMLQGGCPVRWWPQVARLMQ